MELLTIPIITAFTQIFKWELNKKLIPVLSMSIWIILALLLTLKAESPDYYQALIDWIVVGLWASWLYSSGKTVLKTYKDTYKDL